MLDTIEETLRQLREAMEAHRRSLAGEDPAPAIPVNSAPTATRPPRSLAEVAVEVERAAGVQVSGAVAAKLERLFAGSDDVTLAEWLSRIRRPGSLHPELQLIIESLTTHETFFFRDPT